MNREFKPIEFLANECKEENEICNNVTSQILAKAYGKGYREGVEDFTSDIISAINLHREKFGVEYIIHDEESFYGLLNLYEHNKSIDIK